MIGFAISHRWMAIATLATLPAVMRVSRADAAERQETVIDGVAFSLLDGLQIEKVAGPPLIKWPIVADWDWEGRLVIAESGGVSWPIQEHNEKGLHKIVRLVDTDHDGEFDQRIVAADNLAFPEGVLCLGNDILVSAPPVIWKLTDTNLDGVCEQREVWFDGTTVTNCANDLHGPYLGRDGWVYWCKGAFGDQTHALLDGRTLQSSAAHIYRRRLGSPLIEPIISGGMDNPVEMAFIPEGEKFFTSTFLQHPAGGLRDGIGHAVYGGLFGKDHAVVNGHVRTGPLMPVMTQLGPAAPSGLICLETDHVVRSLSDLPDHRFLCAALFNLHKVTAHQLVPEGASFRTLDHDLLVTDRVDFHPTDVIEDADGSLLVLDTGGWYDLCCPTSRIDQTTASGGIYRITSQHSRSNQGTPGSASAPSFKPSDPLATLSDPRPWVQRRAMSTLVSAGDASIAGLREVLDDASQGRTSRLKALWGLCQLGSSDAVAVVIKRLNDSDSSVAQAACHVVSIHRSQAALPSLLTLLGHPSPQVIRAAAEALGRIGDESSVDPLLDALEESDGDRHLDHSLLYALIEINRRVPHIDLVALATSKKRLHVTILALMQLGRVQELDPSRLFAAVQSDHDALRDAAIEALASHGQWAAGSIDSVDGMWMSLDPKLSDGEFLAEIVSGWRDDPAITQLVGRWLGEASSASPQQQNFLASQLHRFSPRSLRPAWSQPIGDWLEKSDMDLQTAIAQSLAQLDLSGAENDALCDRIVRQATRTEESALRFKLLAAIPLGNRIADSDAENEVVSAFVDSAPGLANTASNVLLRCKLSPGQAERLVQAMPRIVPQHLMTAIEAVRRSGIDEVEIAMLDGLLEIPAARTLPRGFLTNLYKNTDQGLRERAERTTVELESPPEDIKQAVDARLKELIDGDPVRGLQVFRSEKAACSGCHRMGYIGKEIGPELTRIGGSRTEAALLEAILYPSARLEQSYQSTRILTVDGQVLNGLLRAHGDDTVELQLNAERKVVIPQIEIELMEPSEISVMPRGIEELLSQQELADLLALLQSAR